MRRYKVGAYRQRRLIREAIEKHDELNPKLWDGKELKPEVRDKIEEIVQKFDDNLKENDVELDVKDICIIGSNANYNYTDDSDVDIHIIADTSVYPDQEDLAMKVYLAYKSLFNNKYDPTLNGIEAEVYVEPDAVQANSNGIYSLKSGWLKEPTQVDVPEVDSQHIQELVEPFEERYNKIINSTDPTVEEVDQLIDDIYLQRQQSIVRDGEFGDGNLCFKEFRNRGYLQKLRDLKVELENKEMSLGLFEDGPIDEGGYRHSKKLTFKKVKQFIDDELHGVVGYDDIIEALMDEFNLTKEEAHGWFDEYAFTPDWDECEEDLNEDDEMDEIDFLTDRTQEQKIYKHLQTNGIYPDEVEVEDENATVTLYGDWKHEHQRCDQLMSEIRYDKVGSREIGDEGDDTGTLIHYYKFNNNPNALQEAFEDEYNNCWVEFMDGEPRFAYQSLKYAQDGIYWDKMAEAQGYVKGTHKYELKYLKDGQYYDSEEQALTEATTMNKESCLKAFRKMAKERDQLFNHKLHHQGWVDEYQDILDRWNDLVAKAEQAGVSHKQINDIWHRREQITEEAKDTPVIWKLYVIEFDDEELENFHRTGESVEVTYDELNQKRNNYAQKFVKTKEQAANPRGELWHVIQGIASEKIDWRKYKNGYSFDEIETIKNELPSGVDNLRKELGRKLLPGLHETKEKDEAYYIEYEYVGPGGRYHHFYSGVAYPNYRAAEEDLADVLSDLEGRGYTEVQGSVIGEEEWERGINPKKKLGEARLSQLKEGVKFKKVWMMGGDQKHPELDDYIEKYVSEKGTEIDCGHGFNNWSTKWYQVGDKNFETLADAKAYVAQLEGESPKEDLISEGMPDDVYNDLVKNTPKTYVVDVYSGVDNPLKYHYEINTGHNIFTKVAKPEWLANTMLVSKPQNSVEEMTKVANKLIDKYNCKEVSNDEYLRIIKESLNEKLDDRVKELLSIPEVKEYIDFQIDHAEYDDYTGDYNFVDITWDTDFDEIANANGISDKDRELLYDYMQEQVYNESLNEDAEHDRLYGGDALLFDVGTYFKIKNINNIFKIQHKDEFGNVSYSGIKPKTRSHGDTVKNLEDGYETDEIEILSPEQIDSLFGESLNEDAMDEAKKVDLVSAAKSVLNKLCKKYEDASPEEIYSKALEVAGRSEHPFVKDNLTAKKDAAIEFINKYKEATSLNEAEYQIPKNELDEYKNWLIKVDKRINKDNVDEYAARGIYKYTWRDMDGAIHRELGEDQESDKKEKYWVKLFYNWKKDPDAVKYFDSIKDARAYGNKKANDSAYISKVELGSGDTLLNTLVLDGRDNTTLGEAASEKVYTVVTSRRGKDSKHSGTLAELIDYFSYTLENGYSWQNAKGNHKIDKHPKTIKALIQNLNWATNNAAANGYSGTTYSLLKEDILDPYYDDELRKDSIPAPEDDTRESLNESAKIVKFLQNLQYGDEVEDYIDGWDVNAWTSPSSYYIVQLDNDDLNKHYHLGDIESQQELEWKVNRLIGQKLTEAPSPDGYQPKQVGKAYKVFRVKNGKLYPPMVANAGGADTPIGVWLDAEEGEFAGLSKTGRKQVKSAKGGMTLAYRPGWHLGDVPRAPQFDRKNKETGEMEFPADFVWAECDYAMDVDYQSEADEQGYMRTKVDDEGNVITTRSDKYQHSLAGLPKLPKDGYYKYRTNPRPDTVPWVITGQMRVNRLLSDDEVNDILRSKGIAPIHRQGGDKTLAELGLRESLEEDADFIGDVVADLEREGYEIYHRDELDPEADEEIIEYMKQQGLDILLSAPSLARFWYFKSLDSMARFFQSGNQLSMEDHADIMG